MSEKIVVLGGFLVTSADVPAAIDSGLVVRGSEIEAVGSNAQLLADHPGAQVIDKRGSLLLPGFVNTHHHLYGVMSHGIHLRTPPASLWPFLNDYWWPHVEDALNQENIRASADWACYEMVNHGITTFYDCLEGTLTIPGALEIVADVVERWGLRAVLSFEATERRSHENGQLGLQENASFIRKWNRPDSLIRGLMCFHTTFTCSKGFIEQAVGLARDLDTRVHMHVSEGTYEPEWCLRKYGKRTLEVYADWDLLGPHILASQCVQVSDREVQLVADAGVHVAHMPLSNCEVGAGFAPIPEMLSRGITVGLGTDGYINDPFQVMRTGLLVPKARLRDATVTSPSTMFRMATENGARCLGLAEVGRFETGFAADLVVLGPHLPTRITDHNLFEQVVLWCNPQDVSDVMVAGRWLKRDGMVLGADETSLRARCREAADQLWANCTA